MSDTIFPEPMDQMDRAMQRMDKKAWAEADAEIALLKARLAEAERVILRMAGEGFARAKIYVDKYDLTGEQAARATDSADEVQK